MMNMKQLNYKLAHNITYFSIHTKLFGVIIFGKFYSKIEKLYNNSKYLLVKQGFSTLMNAMKTLDSRYYFFGINDYRHIYIAIKSLVKLSTLLDKGWKPDDNYIDDKLNFVKDKMNKEYYANQMYYIPMNYILDMDSTKDYNYLAYCLAYYYAKDNIVNIIDDGNTELYNNLYDKYHEQFMNTTTGLHMNPFDRHVILDRMVKSFMIMNIMKALLNNADVFSTEMPEEFRAELIKSELY